MKLGCVPYSISLAIAEDRALRRVRTALRLRSETETLRALIRAAHSELCPLRDVDESLAFAAAHRAANAALRPVKKAKPPVVRECVWGRCRRAFEVPKHNRAQKYCCRRCAQYGSRKR